MMAWCEANGGGFPCDLAQNARLRKRVAREAAAKAAHRDRHGLGASLAG